MPKKSKLNFRFHNPNTPEVTAEHLLAVFMKVNEKKVEEAIKESREKSTDITKESRLVG